MGRAGTSMPVHRRANKHHRLHQLQSKVWHRAHNPSVNRRWRFASQQDFMQLNIQPADQKNIIAVTTFQSLSHPWTHRQSRMEQDHQWPKQRNRPYTHRQRLHKRHKGCDDPEKALPENETQLLERQSRSILNDRSSGRILQPSGSWHRHNREICPRIS